MFGVFDIDKVRPTPRLFKGIIAKALNCIFSSLTFANRLYCTTQLQFYHAITVASSLNRACMFFYAL